MKRYYEGNDGETVEDPEGWYVMFDEAQAEIDSRDKRIAELEALLAHGTAARSEMLDEIHARGARIAELGAGLAEASAKLQRKLLP